jgi:cobyric acid synthase
VHVGKKGEVTVVGNRWYTAKQVLESAAWETGEKFNYREFRSRQLDRLANLVTQSIDMNEMKRIIGLV